MTSRIKETTMVVFTRLAKPSPRSTSWTDFNNVTLDSCVFTAYSTEYRLYIENLVAYVFIALLCHAIVDLIGAFVKYFPHRSFSTLREYNERLFSHTLDEAIGRITRRQVEQ